MTITQECFNKAPRAELPIEGQEPVRYRIINGTSYHNETPFEVVKVLEEVRTSHGRLRLDYGYTTDKAHDGSTVVPGQSWGEIHDIEGYLGRSCGSLKVPLLLSSRRCLGGGPLLDQFIVAIFHSDKAAGRDALYQHPNYKPT